MNTPDHLELNDDLKFWTPAQTAKQLEIHKRRVYELVKEGTLWHIHLGSRRLRISVGKLMEMMNSTGDFGKQRCNTCHVVEVEPQLWNKMSHIGDARG